MKPILMKRGGRLAALLAFAVVVAAACGDDEVDDQEEPAKTPAQLACEAVQEYVTGCGTVSPCDQALLDDCAKVMGSVADAYVVAVTQCIEAKKPPMTCLGESLSALKATAAQQALAAKYCSECALGIPGCESAFFGEGADSDAKLGVVLLPFGDDVVNEVAEKCAQGFGCAATFLECAKQTLLARAIPENTLQCMVDNLLNPQPAPADPCGQGGAASSSQTSSSTGGGDVMCVDLSAKNPPCTAADPAACMCNGCLGVCVGDPNDPASYSDCVCPECATDAYCMNTANCVNDGLCDPRAEGCVCADCASHASCS